MELTLTRKYQYVPPILDDEISANLLNQLAEEGILLLIYQGVVLPRLQPYIQLEETLSPSTFHGEQEEASLTPTERIIWTSNTFLNEEISTNLVNFYLDHHEFARSQISSLPWTARGAVDDDLLYFCVINPTSGLLAWWGLHESQGHSRLDSSGNGKTLPEVLGSVEAASGLIWGAANFTSTSILRIASNIIASGSFSISFWLNPTDIPIDFYTLVRQGSIFVALDNDGTITVNVNSGQSLVSNATISANTWNHILCTFDGNTLNLFINNLLDSSVNGLTVSYNSTLFGVGGISGLNILNGKMQLVGIWNRALDNGNAVLGGSAGCEVNYLYAGGAGRDLFPIGMDDEQPLNTPIEYIYWLPKPVMYEETPTTLTNFYLEQEEPTVLPITNIIWMVRSTCDEDPYPVQPIVINIDEEQASSALLENIYWVARSATDDEIGSGLKNFYIEDEFLSINDKQLILDNKRLFTDEDSLSFSTVLEQEDSYTLIIQNIIWIARNAIYDEISSNLSNFYILDEDERKDYIQNINWVAREVRDDEIGSGLSSFYLIDDDELRNYIETISWVARNATDNEISSELRSFYLEQEEYVKDLTENTIWQVSPARDDEIGARLSNFGLDQEEFVKDIFENIIWVARSATDDELSLILVFFPHNRSTGLFKVNIKDNKLSVVSVENKITIKTTQ